MFLLLERTEQKQKNRTNSRKQELIRTVKDLDSCTGLDPVSNNYVRSDAVGCSQMRYDAIENGRMQLDAAGCSKKVILNLCVEKLSN